MFDLQEGEKIIRYIRKHWIFLFLDIVSSFLLFIIPVSVVWYLQLSGYVADINLFHVSLNNLIDIFVWIWAILCWLFLTEKFTKYALNFWILTNRRIVESEFLKLFSRRISTLELTDVEDVTVGVAGFVQTIIGYGSLEVQTAGSTREFLANNIWNPAQVQEDIFEAKLELKKDSETGYQSKGPNNLEKYMSNKTTSRDQNTGHHFTIPQDQNRYESTNRMVEDKSVEKDEGTQKAFDWAHRINEDAKVEDVYDRSFDGLEEKYKKDSQKALRIE
jgi:uncharacterized membrane protein YdbT with pleckstrin-like domain